MSFKVPWKRPYEGLPETSDKAKRLTVRVSSEDTDTIVSVTANPLILTTICEYAIKECADYVRKHNLTLADQRALIDRICGRTDRQSSQETNERDGGGRVKGARSGVKKSPAEPPRTGESAAR